MNWNTLTTIDELDEAIKVSDKQPVLIFKHSTRCSISSAALDRLQRKWEGQDLSTVAPYYLDLIAYREISNEITQKLGIYHQSPQALLIKEGKVIYEESHFSISCEEIASAAVASS
ncbi:MAG: bacillithiol system protein YtxJ [Cyclobacteriaceae bacterium]|jgi:bacillithiol system protein YtxJ